MRARFYSAISLILLLAVLAMGIAPAQAAVVASPGPPPCCAHDEAEPDAAPACPTVECPHCGMLSVELSDTTTCGTILKSARQRFPEAATTPPETYPVPLEYPPRA